MTESLVFFITTFNKDKFNAFVIQLLTSYKNNFIIYLSFMIRCQKSLYTFCQYWANLLFRQKHCVMWVLKKNVKHLKL